jgi:hypothetical protein
MVVMNQSPARDPGGNRKGHNIDPCRERSRCPRIAKVLILLDFLTPSLTVQFMQTIALAMTILQVHRSLLPRAAPLTAVGAWAVGLRLWDLGANPQSDSNYLQL